MKKLSLQEKAKRYDLAIEAARCKYNLMEEGGNFGGMEDLEEIFPELQKGEDEKIREFIIECIEELQKSCTENADFNGKCSGALAWLEKQGELVNFLSKGLDNAHERIDWLIQKNNSLIEQLEKQGEQKPTDNQFTPEQANLLDKHIDSALEQKSTNKVEPKFKISDWIVSNVSHEDYRVCKILNGEYAIESICGYRGHNNFETFDKNYHLWTIEDAKDGDVLASHECLVLFKEIDGLNIKCYCTYHYLNHQAFYVDTLQNKTAFHPATKEQRELLFQKMKEAGYEWDSEHKQLKNIEQKSDENKGMNIVEEDMTPFQKKVFCIIDTTIEEEQGLKQVCDELLRLAHDEGMQKPTEWSEEDERIYQSIMDDTVQENQLDDKQTNWLENIKYRNFARPQNTWKPSKEQLHYLSWIANVRLGDSVVEQEVSKHLNELYNDLKKLKG